MKCENCNSRKVEHYDVEGVPFCQRCWDDPSLWEPTAPEAADAQPVN